MGSVLWLNLVWYRMAAGNGGAIQTNTGGRGVHVSVLLFFDGRETKKESRSHSPECVKYRGVSLGFYNGLDLLYVYLGMGWDGLEILGFILDRIVRYFTGRWFTCLGIIYRNSSVD